MIRDIVLLLLVAGAILTGASCCHDVSFRSSDEVGIAEKGKGELVQSDEGAGGEAKVEGTTYCGAGFTVSCPPGVEVAQGLSLGGMTMYHFSYRGDTVLTAEVHGYSGYPDDETIAGLEIQGLINDLPFARKDTHLPGGGLRREVLLRFPDDRFWPALMHLWYDHALPERRQMGEAIIGSVRACEEGAELYPPLWLPHHYTRKLLVVGEDLEGIERKLQALKRQAVAPAELERLNELLASIRELRTCLDDWMFKPYAEMEPLMREVAWKEDVFMRRLRKLVGRTPGAISVLFVGGPRSGRPYEGFAYAGEDYEALGRRLQALRNRHGTSAELEQLAKHLASIDELRERIDGGQRRGERESNALLVEWAWTQNALMQGLRTLEE